MAQERIPLQFFGQTYYLAGGGELREVVELVEGMASRIQERHPDLPVNRLVVLTVLEMADELLRLRRGFQWYKRGVEDEARRLVEGIDEILASSPQKG